MTSILDEAAAITSGDRQDDYGHPQNNHGCTAALWSAWIARRYGVHVPLDADAVCMLNVLQKLSRHAHAPKRDNLVDIAGYMRNAEVCADARTE